MKRETTKSFVLIVLIGISLLLSYGLWSYQPNDEILNPEQLVNEVDIGGQEKLQKDILAPSKMIFHSEDHHYGFSNPIDQQHLFEKIQSWTMYNFETKAADGRKEKKYEVELVFPSAIPMELVGRMFNFNDDIILPEWSFQRMYFTFQSEKASLKVQFLSENGKQQATAIINDSNHYEQLWSKVFSPNELDEYMVVNEGQLPIYFPKEKMSLPKWSLIIEKIEPRELVNALFPNPTVVTRPNVGTSNGGETYYTDTQRQMKVFQERSMEFISPYTSDNNQMDPLNLLESSIKKINEHKGWTETYHLLDIKARGSVNQVRYQMFTDGYPVFNSSNLSLIEQEWRDQMLTKYRRPLFRFGDPINSEKVELPSGQDVISYLENSADYQLENVKDIQIGYKLNYMDEDSYTPYVSLEPAWYMNYNGAWAEVKFFAELTQTKGGN